MMKKPLSLYLKTQVSQIVQILSIIDGVGLSKKEKLPKDVSQKTSPVVSRKEKVKIVSAKGVKKLSLITEKVSTSSKKLPPKIEEKCEDNSKQPLFLIEQKEIEKLEAVSTNPIRTPSDGPSSFESTPNESLTKTAQLHFEKHFDILAPSCNRLLKLLMMKWSIEHRCATRPPRLSITRKTVVNSWKRSSFVNLLIEK